MKNPVETLRAKRDHDERMLLELNEHDDYVEDGWGLDYEDWLMEVGVVDPNFRDWLWSSS